MPFREVHGEDAGPSAVGILVPPGRRTVVVVRPRSLDVDLLLVRRGDDGAPLAGFHETGCGEALMLARNLSRAFGSVSITVQPANDGGCHILAEVGAFVLIVCGRVPGQAYRPLLFPTDADAQPTADAVRAVLCPAPGTERQVYLNTQHFAR